MGSGDTLRDLIAVLVEIERRTKSNPLHSKSEDSIEFAVRLKKIFEKGLKFESLVEETLEKVRNQIRELLTLAATGNKDYGELSWRVKKIVTFLEEGDPNAALAAEKWMGILEESRGLAGKLRTISIDEEKLASNVEKLTKYIEKFES